MFLLESPHRGDSNEYTQYTIFNIKKENRPKLSQICSYGIFSWGLKHEFETAMVNKPSVFEPLKFYCNGPMQSNSVSCGAISTLYKPDTVFFGTIILLRHFGTTETELICIIINYIHIGIKHVFLCINVC